MALLEKPDIVEIISHYVDLKQVGVNWRGLCPFHDEKTPSFTVSPSRHIFTCFGCGAKGDVVGFVMKYHGTDFRGALGILGISSDQRLNHVDPVKARARELKQEYRQWKDQYCLHLSKTLHRWDNIREGIKDVKTAEALAAFYHKASVWQLHWETLLSGDDDLKFNLFKKVRDEYKNR